MKSKSKNKQGKKNNSVATNSSFNSNPKTKSKSNKKNIRFDSLAWNNVSTSLNFIDKEFEHDDMSGFLGLEVIEGVKCDWEEDEFGRTLKFERVNDEEEEEKPISKKKRDFYDMPLTEEEMKTMEFIHLDDFDTKDTDKNKAIVEIDEELDESIEDESDEELNENIEEESEEDFSNVPPFDGFSPTPESTEIAQEDESDDSFIPEDIEESEEDLNEIEDLSDVEPFEGFSSTLESSSKDGEEVSEAFDFDSLDVPTVKKDAKKSKTKVEKVEPAKNSKDSDLKLDKEPSIQAWLPFGLALPLLKALQTNNFLEPTEIQSLTLAPAIQGRDIIGAAETGSGKTLAFGLPILNHLCNTNKINGELYALILAPTRELALQIADHLKSVSKFTDIKIASVVGGLSRQKQNRLLNNNPNILVATPGRLWDLVQEEDSLKDKLLQSKALVIDEADRMIEAGHFVEVKKLLDLFNRSNKVNSKRQTYIFSATLESYSNSQQTKKNKKTESNLKSNSLEQIFTSIKFKDAKPCLVNLTSKKQTSAGLTELRIDCIKKDKDNLLHYLLKKFSGRTIVFVNSIDAIRRLVPTLKLLKVEALALHAGLEQKQRLNTVDKFKQQPQGVIIASDVAARGLDIPDVDQVIHYNLPPNEKLYIHRSGRTARAAKSGASIILNSPDELKIYTKLCKALKRTNIPTLDLDRLLVNKFERLTELAREIETLTHRLNKSKAETNWFVKSAEAMDIELDPQFLPNNDSNSEARDSNMSKKLKNLKAQLNATLKVQILPTGSRKKFMNFSEDEKFISRLGENGADGVSVMDRVKLLDQVETNKVNNKNKKVKKN